MAFVARTTLKWLEGKHTGKTCHFDGHERFETADEAVASGNLYHPPGYVYRHGSTGHRQVVVGSEAHKPRK